MSTDSRAAEISKRLTKAQRELLFDLSADWQQRGYSKVEADLLWAADSRLIEHGFGPLVDCRLHDQPGQGRFYQHRLLRLGLQVRAIIEGEGV